ncbi:hypothetical protein [Aureimonas sp. Leaf324]|uniref:hypothetical protein n=1 Tax=Aureimonas sp. Leaf324 TaxID=1736336 RepID=UPI0006F9FA9D|nr:hypothetical protein [Aureimonas sp. Leaf324]KQQ82087.1 hypothetical protein ASF65_08595 [Aureimonas sp. Leaf324]
MSGQRNVSRRTVPAILLAVTCAVLSGCQSDVLPAVFGLGSGGVSAYAPGKLPEIVARPGDRLIGRSGTDRGRCIFENAVGNRFRADCPDGFTL